MARTDTAADFHKQLILASDQRLRERGQKPIQHVAVEGGGRPDLVGRDEKGGFKVIVECLVRSPTLQELEKLRTKYEKRRLVIAVPAGTKLPESPEKLYDELWEFPVTLGSYSVLPVETLELSKDAFDAVERYRTEHKIRAMREAIQEIINSQEVIGCVAKITRV